MNYEGNVLRVPFLLFTDYYLLITALMPNPASTTNSHREQMQDLVP
jgi:hypothetical protein